MTRRWWKRNRWGLLLLGPACVLAVGAGSLRLFTVYLPQTPVFAHHSSDVAVLKAEDSPTPQSGTSDMEARFTPVSAEKLDASFTKQGPWEGQSFHPVAGGVAWKVTIDVEADPLLTLNTCRLAILDDRGREYGMDRGWVFADGVSELDPQASRCVPADGTGPTYVPRGEDEGGGVRIAVKEGEERPSSWVLERYVVLPEGVEPDRLAIYWWHRKGVWTVSIPR